MLRGRDKECSALDQLLKNVRSGSSQVVVLRGEPGIGKSAMLAYAGRSATGCRVAQAAGIEYEMELAYAGLHQLCAPLLDLRDRLPQPQRDALEAAFGLSAGPPPDRFVVGLGVLGLLSEAADEQPLVCLVDDAHWFDHASMLTMAFVARRLQAESVALVFSVREGSQVRELDGLPELVLGGLSDSAARALLDAAWPGRLDEHVRERLIAEARGNALALLELPRGLSSEELAGGFGSPRGARLAGQVQQSFVRQIEALPEESRLFLLAAAAEPSGDAALLWRAAHELGLGPDVAAPAQKSRLIELGVMVRFRHPLVRSTIYHAAPLVERQLVHGALASATDPVRDPDRRAWHRGQAAAGLDEAAAEELEQSAGRARARGGVAAAAAFLERAVELTPDLPQRARRALAAAQAKLESGALDAARNLLEIAEASPLDEHSSAQLALVRAQLAFAINRGSDAPPLLLDAARRLAPFEPEAARDAFMEALGAAVFAGRLGGAVTPHEVIATMRERPVGRHPDRPTEVLLDALATRFTEGYAEAVVPLQRALGGFARDEEATDDDLTRWFWLPWLVAGDLWDDTGWHELATRAVGLCRRSGAVLGLPLALGYRAVVHVHAGELGAASALVEEAHSINEATGNAPVGYPAGLLAAFRGVETEYQGAVSWAVDNLMERGEGRGIGGAGYFEAIFHNGAGRYEQALAGARLARSYDDFALYGFALVELVEAAVRLGARDEAADAVRQLEERTQAAGTEWALGSRARSLALLSEGATAEALYREAIERLGRTRIAVHLGRAHLVYGEWLRRENRRKDARDQLRVAHDLLRDMGVEGFAERARRELAAAGGASGATRDESGVQLTYQESQIARLARDGLSNPEIGAELFISRHTVEWHLRKVFAKLNITSRRQLSGVPTSRLDPA